MPIRVLVALAALASMTATDVAARQGDAGAPPARTESAAAGDRIRLRTSLPGRLPRAGTAVHDAVRFVLEHSASFGMLAGEAVARHSAHADDGWTYVWIARHVQGVPVAGEELVVAYDGRGALRRVQGKVRTSLPKAPRSSLSAEAAEQAARAAVGGSGLATLSSGWLWQRGDAGYRLVRRVILHGPETPPVRVDVDARTGHAEARPAMLSAVPGTGRSIYSGTVPIHTTFDPDAIWTPPYISSGSLPGYPVHEIFTFLFDSYFRDDDNDWGDHSPANVDSEISDLLFGMDVAQQYWHLFHGRFGLDGNGGPVVSRGNAPLRFLLGGWCNAGYNYALDELWWGGGDAVEGCDPFVTLEIIGHETAHKVGAASLGTSGVGENGVVGEGVSDFFGAHFQHWAAGTGRWSGTPDWHVADEPIFPNGPLAGVVRHLDGPQNSGPHPTCGGSYPRHYTQRRGPSCPDQVHIDSTIVSHALYCLVANCTNVGGGPLPSTLSFDAVARIVYRAFTTAFNAATDMHSARDDIVDAAHDLYGSSTAELVGLAFTGAGLCESGAQEICWNGWDDNCNGTIDGFIECAVVREPDPPVE